MDLMRPNALKYPDKVGEGALTNSKLKLMQNINRENLEDVEAKLAQGQRKGILDVLNVRQVERWCRPAFIPQ